MNIVDKQSIFQRVAEHLINQGEKAIDVDKECCYRAVNEDNKPVQCAIGVLMTDDTYDFDMEQKTVEGLGQYINFNADMKERFNCNLDSIEDARFLAQLQEIHDQSEPEDWVGLLHDFAKREGLRLIVEG